MKSKQIKFDCIYSGLSTRLDGTKDEVSIYDDLVRSVEESDEFSQLALFLRDCNLETFISVFVAFFVKDYPDDFFIEGLFYDKGYLNSRKLVSNRQDFVMELWERDLKNEHRVSKIRLKFTPQLNEINTIKNAIVAELHEINYIEDSEELKLLDNDRLKTIKLTPEYFEMNFKTNF